MIILNPDAWYARSLIRWGRCSRDDLIEGYRVPKSLCQLVRSLLFMYSGVFIMGLAIGMMVVMPAIFSIVCYLTDSALWHSMELEGHTKLFSVEGLIGLGAIDICSILFFVVIFGGVWVKQRFTEWNTHRKWEARKRTWADIENDVEVPAEPNILLEWIKAIHNKVCPMIEFAPRINDNME